jgi:hypothetical protein
VILGLQLVKEVYFFISLKIKENTKFYDMVKEIHPVISHNGGIIIDPIPIYSPEIQNYWKPVPEEIKKKTL